MRSVGSIIKAVFLKKIQLYLEKFSQNELLIFGNKCAIIISRISADPKIKTFLEEITMMNLGEKIKTLRKQKNISQEVFANYLGVSF